MPDFTVRVEIKDADGEDYQKLHERMEAKGYSREITGDSGQVYKLPDAEYQATKNLTTHDVREEVRAIAGSVKTDIRVLVTKSNGRSWYLSVKK